MITPRIEPVNPARNGEIIFIYISSSNVPGEPTRDLNTAFKVVRRTVSAQTAGSAHFILMVLIIRETSRSSRPLSPTLLL